MEGIVRVFTTFKQWIINTIRDILPSGVVNDTELQKYSVWMFCAFFCSAILLRVSKKYFSQPKFLYAGPVDVQGRRHGHGRLELPNGDVYEGGFVRNRMHGHGKYTFKNGGILEAEFRDSYAHGRGRETYVDGSEYRGDFRHGLRHGKGRMIYAQGHRLIDYKGPWVGGCKHGRGELRFSSALTSEATFKERDAIRFVGEFVDGKRHGEGVEYHRDYTIRGTWKEGQQSHVEIINTGAG